MSNIENGGNAERHEAGESRIEQYIASGFDPTLFERDDPETRQRRLLQTARLEVGELLSISTQLFWADYQCQHTLVQVLTRSRERMLSFLNGYASLWGVADDEGQTRAELALIYDKCIEDGIDLFGRTIMPSPADIIDGARLYFGESFQPTEEQVDFVVTSNWRTRYATIARSACAPLARLESDAFEF